MAQAKYVRPAAMPFDGKYQAAADTPDSSTRIKNTAMTSINSTLKSVISMRRTSEMR
ncbi:MAG: hypothetical protein LUG91_04415 [Ruminococcus sp.]|nr:hypothetical protein [Ruminococcus sp.]MCD7811080.1 hypothetical protein [Ruminococcus sp.]